jgi:cytochrome c peroxidase
MRQSGAPAAAIWAAGLAALSGLWGGCVGGATPEVYFEGAKVTPAVSVTDEIANAFGRHRTVSANGPVSPDHLFFRSVGTNGRACVHCHTIEEGFSITPAGVQRRFDASDGTDPIFRLVDGANSPLAEVGSTSARRAAYSLLLSRAVIRVGMPVPAGAEFELAGVDDPYGYASAGELSLFRRPLPSTNVRFLSGVMWDGRESAGDRTVDDALLAQAESATRGHAEAARSLTPEERRALVDLQRSLSTAQVYDVDAKQLDVAQGRGGPEAVSTQPFWIGINDVLGADPTGAAFTPDVFTLYDKWAGGGSPAQGSTAAARRAVARGQALFNRKPIRISGVRGVNDDLGVEVLEGTCTTCHDTPNVGNHSVPFALDLGLTDEARRTPDMPLYTLRNKATGELRKTTDPGRALVTGRWKDIGRFKGPILRGLAARAPYFHNGSAASLEEVVAFYDQRFAIGLSAAERADLVAFLRTL